MESRASATVVLETLRAEAADECHSRQQHEYVTSQRKAGVQEKLPVYKKGSRIVDTAEYTIGLEKGLMTEGPHADEVFISKMLNALSSAAPVLLDEADPPVQVSFQWKNPDFLLKNPDLLIRNPDFLLKNVDFIIKPEPDCAISGVAHAYCDRRPFLLPQRSTC